MPNTPADQYRAAIGRTLAHRAGADPDGSTIARAAVGTWQQIVARLVPVIGARGVEALFRRSLHLKSASWPWLSIAADHGDTAGLLALLEKRLAACETNVAAEASGAMLVTFVELLATLIGESLTERLLGPVWVPALPASEQETKS